MGKIMIALLIAIISITIALDGVRKDNIKKDLQYNTSIRGEDKNVYTKSYETTLGPYYQLRDNTGYTYIGKSSKGYGKSSKRYGKSSKR